MKTKRGTAFEINLHTESQRDYNTDRTCCGALALEQRTTAAEQPVQKETSLSTLSHTKKEEMKKGRQRPYLPLFIKILKTHLLALTLFPLY